jgi:hypothetical protein
MMVNKKNNVESIWQLTFRYLQTTKVNFPSIQFLSPGGSTIHTQGHGGSIDAVISIFVACA